MALPLLPSLQVEAASSGRETADTVRLRYLAALLFFSCQNSESVPNVRLPSGVFSLYARTFKKLESYIQYYYYHTVYGIVSWIKDKDKHRPLAKIGQTRYRPIKIEALFI
jgi:hypothetical protein